MMEEPEYDVVDVKVMDHYCLYLTFSDGKEGVVDIEKIITFDGIFSALENTDYFQQVSVNPDIGTICWDNGADISPHLLYKNCHKKNEA